MEVAKVNAAIQQGVQGDAESRSAGARAKSRAHKNGPRWKWGGHRTGVGSGNMCTAALVPDQVHASIRQYEGWRSAFRGNDPYPQTR